MTNAQQTDLDPIVASVRQRLGEMEAKMLEQDPNLPGHLAAIHETLIKYEELVHLLSEQEIATLVKGQKRFAGVQLVTAAITKKTGPRTVPKGSSIADDL